MPDLPTGTVTFLFTDIEGSTRLLQHLEDRYADVLNECRRLLHSAVQERGGQEVDTQGDAFFFAFTRARDAAAAAVTAQRAINAHQWPAGGILRVRMGLHTGEALAVRTGYVGMDVHRAARICSAAHGGQILLSQTTRDLVERDLPEGVSLRDLGEHRLKDLQRSEKIFQALHAALPSEFPAPRTLDTLSNNLPVQLTSFIGREREIAEIKRLLSTTRLLTLSGSGGAGKTRLALQVAADLLDRFANGLWVVELAPLSDSTLLPHTVASTLGVREEAGRTVMESLVDYLRPRSILLVLDNCEHLVVASAHLAAALIRTCPGVRIVATSREPLGVSGEIVYRVPSLSWPHPQRLPSLETLTRYEAVRLFIERAALHRPEFTITESNAGAVTQVCQRLDGMPLAIELAAARVKVLSVEQIAARLDDRFRLLTGGGRMSLPRHQTLRAAIDWSYDLLSEKERALLRRVSVFAGGFSLDAAEAVCSEEGCGREELLDILMQLVEKSLAIADTQGGAARYRLLETVRQYGREKLEEARELAAVRIRHGSWYLGLAERAEPELQGPDQKKWLHLLEAEHDNLREALAFSVEGGPGDEALRLAAALWWFWHVHGYLGEGRAWLSRALAGTHGALSPARARALYGAGFLAWRQGEFGRAQALGRESLALFRDLGHRTGMASATSLLENVARAQGHHEEAAALLEESVALFRDLGDSWGIATTLLTLGNAVRFQGNHARATSLLEESRDLFRTLGDKSGTAASLHFLGLVARDQGDYAQAEKLNRECLSLSRIIGDHSRVAFSLHALGLVARDRGDYGQAEGLFAESLALFRELEDTWGVTTALVSLGLVARLRGDCTRASALLKESLTLRRDLGDRWGIAECLEGLAGAAVAQRQPERAAWLLGAAEALAEAIGAPLSRAQRADRDRSAATAQKQLGKRAFAAAWEAGRRIGLEKAVEDALAPPPSERVPVGFPGRTPGTPLSVLTRREQEVASLIAQGRTNREIARMLVITEGTAANHVQHILNKLGLQSRAQIAAWAVEQGLFARSHNS